MHYTKASERVYEIFISFCLFCMVATWGSTKNRFGEGGSLAGWHHKLEEACADGYIRSGI